MFSDEIEAFEDVVCVHCERAPTELPYIDDWRMTEFGCECPECQAPPDADAEPLMIEDLRALIGVLDTLGAFEPPPSPPAMRPRTTKRFRRPG